MISSFCDPSPAGLSLIGEIGELPTDKKFSISPSLSGGPLSHLFPTNVDFEEIVFEFQRTVSCCIILRQSKQTKMNFYTMMVEIE